MRSVAEVLEDAAELIRTQGWTQKNLHDDNGYCALGALAHVCGSDSELAAYTPILGSLYSKAVGYMYDTLEGMFPQEYPGDMAHSIARFNDTRQSAQEVIQFMLEASARSSAQPELSDPLEREAVFA